MCCVLITVSSGECILDFYWIVGLHLFYLIEHHSFRLSTETRANWQP